MKYFIFTLGCQMNVGDSQRITQKLEDLGFKSASEKTADLVIVNACSVRQTAVDRIWGKIRLWQESGKKIFLTGCVLPIDKKKFAQKNIVFFNIQDLPNLNNILRRYANIRKNIRISSQDTKNACLEYFKIKPKMNGRTAYIPIMTGCDNFCSYCAVPHTRGREVSRPEKDILKDVNDATKRGFKEIILLGQNVNSYGLKSEILNPKSETNSKLEISNSKQIQNNEFIKLLKTIDELPYDFTFNFISSNPHDMSKKLTNTLATLKKWPRELHLPLQSGDDEILKKMNRKYTSGQFLALISKLKNQISNIKITTDIIVGFPSETKKQFENTLKICKKIGFEKAYIAQYSSRSGTAAAKLKDNVSKTEKKKRWLVLEKIINEK